MQKLLNDLYVDDSTSGFFNVKEAYGFCLNVKQFIKESGFEFCKCKAGDTGGRGHGPFIFLRSKKKKKNQREKKKEFQGKKYQKVVTKV